MGGTYTKNRKEKEEKLMVINSPIPSIKKTNSDTHRTLSAVNLKVLQMHV